MIYRAEYPRPQFVRRQWQNLNGQWEFEFDDSNTGMAERWYRQGHRLARQIEVPFAFQTELSGIGDRSFHDWVWYKRSFRVSEQWAGKRILLHFGAVDYRAWVYVNGQLAGTHEGGHVPFHFDITDLLNGEEEEVSVRVEDPSEDETIPRGKQFWQEQSDAIWYSRTTGIWQTVWLEPVSPVRMEKMKFHPDLDAGDIDMEWYMAGGQTEGLALQVEVFFRGQTIISDLIDSPESYGKRAYNLFSLRVFRTGFHNEDTWAWSPEKPNLFGVKLTVSCRGQIVDEVESYFGMRKVHTENGMVYLNNKPYYQKLVLDQGYWPEGLLTAPSDEALKQDILLAKEMGFNGCRKHQKVEDPRFLYWADQLGFLVWGECASTASFNENAVARLTREWLEIIERDYNHPSIVAWVPLNESWGVPMIRSDVKQQSHSKAMYHLIHSLDNTRLVISNDGWEMTETDICAVHNYNHGQAHETAKYAAFQESLLSRASVLQSQPARRKLYVEGYAYRGEPILLTEFGGIAYRVGSQEGWGYSTVQSEEDFVSEYGRVVDAVYASRVIHGFCYTQLTDVEQEMNGLLTYDRKPKCRIGAIRSIHDRWHDQIVKEERK